MLVAEATSTGQIPSHQLAALAAFVESANAELAATPLWRESAAGAYWVTNRKLIAEALRQSETKEAFLGKIFDLYVFTIHHLFKDRSVAEAYVRWQAEALAALGIDLARLDAALGESRFADPAVVFDVSGRAVSPEFLRVMTYVGTLARYLPDLPASPRFCEVGPGYGALARVLALYFPGARGVLIDLPESLAASFVFLSLSFPGRAVVLARSAADVAAARDSADFLLVPVHLADCLRGAKVDLVVNTCSLGEMKNDVVDYWRNFIADTIEARFVFSWNRFMNEMSPVSTYRSGENAGAFLFDRDWILRHWEWDPPAQRAPYIDTLAPAYLCQIAERARKTDAARAEDRARSRALLGEVLLEDWARAANKADLPWQPVRTQNLHCFDGTQRGTLFKLWEAVRLSPNRVTIGWMLHYLRFLRAGLPETLRFEEEAYLEKRRDRLPEPGVDADAAEADWLPLRQRLDAYRAPVESERVRAAALLRRRFDEALAAHAAARTALDAERAARGETEAALAGAKADLAASRQVHERSAQENAALAQALAAERQARQQREAELAQLGKVLAERDAAIAALESRLRAIEASISWRLTKPFRRLRNLARERDARTH